MLKTFHQQMPKVCHGWRLVFASKHVLIVPYVSSVRSHLLLLLNAGKNVCLATSGCMIFLTGSFVPYEIPIGAPCGNRSDQADRIH